MKQSFRFISSAFMICLTSGSALGKVEVPQLENLFLRLESTNREIKYSQIQLANQEEGVNITESFTLPSLSWGNMASQSNNNNWNPSSVSSVPGVDSSATYNGTPVSTLASNMNGWISSLSTTYLLFTHYALSDAIESAKLNRDSAALNYEHEKIVKKSHLIQVLMEWQWLRQVKEPLQQAIEVSQAVKEHSKTAANLLYSESDHAEVSEKFIELEYNYLKVNEALALAESALHDLLPDVKNDELEKIPVIATEYELPPVEILNKLYNEKSTTSKVQMNDLKVSEFGLHSSRWNKPWIPTAAFTGSYYETNTYTAGSAPQNGWSVNLILNFDLYDGGLTQATNRRAQILHDLAINKQADMASKSFVALQAQRSKAVIAQAEFKLSSSRVHRKSIALKDVRSKRQRGVATKLEETAALLDFSKSAMEALDSLKNYQSASLGLAVDINEWEKVKIHEKKM